MLGDIWVIQVIKNIKDQHIYHLVVIVVTVSNVIVKEIELIKCDYIINSVIQKILKLNGSPPVLIKNGSK